MTKWHILEQFQRFVQIFGTDNRQTIADALVFRTLAHEVGHALGLNHPNDTSEEPFDTAGMITLGWARTTTFTRDIAATPLMIGDQMAYLEALAARLRTPVTTANMAPTVHELFAIGVENDCGGPISQPSTDNKTSMSDDTCTNKPRIFYPLAARLSAAIGMSVLK
ncbi:hypothetical protein ATN84_06925 [Paramesorhizobium deserti]|uniref:Peptidase M10 metallopeptidase domain-containing protein n=1 Tax=Paramesorhizobium deserti TaxID=1494590 RepID=A0A135I1V8_9HYPH|nr:hypothetical protein ATN84_06925 [Paramesorhizobium deserti]